MSEVIIIVVALAIGVGVQFILPGKDDGAVEDSIEKVASETIKKKTGIDIDFDKLEQEAKPKK